MDSSRNSLWNLKYFILVFTILALQILSSPAQGSGARCERSMSTPSPSSTNDVMEDWPIIRLGKKGYYIGHFFKANWYKANEYCRFHGMQLASIESKAENDLLEKTAQDFGLALEHFWTSGSDLGEEGVFTWFGNGRPLTFTNWNTGEPNNFRYENGEEEHCLELWNRDGKGLRWNDTPCSFQTYFICER